MKEFQAGPNTYRTSKLGVITQFHVARRLGVAFAELIPIVKIYSEARQSANAKGAAVAQETGTEVAGDAATALLLRVDFTRVVEPFSKAFAALSDDDANYIINACLDACERRQEGGAWARVRLAHGEIMFNDLSLGVLLSIIWNVLQESLDDFFAILPQIFGATSAQPGV